MDYKQRAHTIIAQTMKDKEADKILNNLLGLNIEEIAELAFCLIAHKEDQNARY